MIYQFPDLDALQVAIRSGYIAQEIILAPAIAGLDDEGHVWLQPSVALPRKAQTALRKWGVQSCEAIGDLQAEEVSCWLQMLPVQRDPAPLALSSQSPVLFELTDAAQLPGLVGEMLRLGNDRQSIRWLKDGRKDRVLLRVIGPPYYSLLRALDADGQAAAPRAYVERAPNVWVAVGHTHALVHGLKLTGQLLLMRPPRDWAYLEEGPFRDIYEILDFTLPHAGLDWKDSAPDARIQVPLKLVPGGSRDVDELWVLRENAFDTVDTFVRTNSDGILDRLAFAVGAHQGQGSIVLRVRPSKQLPPVVELPGAVKFRPFNKLPNLFLPAGLSLQPPLRRDAVRQLLASDPDQVVWLYPHGDGAFTPQTLPDSAFRPLRDWVEYVLDRDRQALETWIASARFDFDAFICKDDEEKTPKTPRGKAPTGRERRSMLADDVDEALDLTAATAPKGKAKARPAEDAFAPLPEAKPSELQRQLRELKKQFQETDGPLDAPERLALWSQMAVLNGALNQPDDAAVCWLNALWDHDTPPPDWVWQWLRTEMPLRERCVSGAELDRLLALSEPLAVHVRTLAACVVAAGSDDSTSVTAQAVIERMPRIRTFLEKHEIRLGIRAAWLAWSSLSRLSSGDVLALARARDRLLERLLNHGLNLEYDMPSFLRFSGQHSSDRFRSVLDRIIALRDRVHQWVARCAKEEPLKFPGDCLEATQAYKDLIFAFGLGRLGESGRCRELQQQARKVLAKKDVVHTFLLDAYSARIEQAVGGKPHSGHLPDDLQDQLKRMETLGRQQREQAKQKPEQGQGQQSPELFRLFKINRLREYSRILEPQEKVNAYREWQSITDDLGRELAKLEDLADKPERQKQILRLLQAQKKPQEVLRVLATGLELAPRISEPFTVELLSRLVALRDQLPPILNQPELEQRAALWERALFLAAHYDRAEHLQQLVSGFVQLLESLRGDSAAQALDRLAGQCFRGLRKLGLRQEIENLLHRMTELVTQGQDLAALRSRLAGNWHDTLRTLLQLASGWLYFAHVERAVPILNEARLLLVDENEVPTKNRITTPVFRVKLACAYITTLGQAPVDEALKQLEELFGGLANVADSFTTHSHYSLHVLQLVEALVLAVASDDFAVGQNVRRWLDEDEYLVRRRIHRDLRLLMNQAGV